MKIFSLFLAYNIAFARFLYQSNKRITVTKREIELERLPKEFDGFTIAHVSDYHNAFFGVRARKLLKKIKSIDADVIFFTGDLIDRRTPNLRRAKMFIQRLSQIGPVYFVTGNHEINYKGFGKLYDAIGGSSFRNVSMHDTTLEHNGARIHLLGMNDVWFYSETESMEMYYNFYEQLTKKVNGAPGFKILLSHRPELLSMYHEHDIDLVFSGHAHGGQFRVPIIKGLYAPHQGIFPKYTEGVYRKGRTQLHVSRGLGNSRFPYRLFNRPEIIKVTLRQE